MFVLFGYSSGYKNAGTEDWQFWVVCFMIYRFHTFHLTSIAWSYQVENFWQRGIENGFAVPESPTVVLVVALLVSPTVSAVTI